MVDQGRIIQQGPHSELIAQPTGLYRKLYDVQFGDQATALSAEVRGIGSAGRGAGIVPLPVPAEGESA